MIMDYDTHLTARLARRSQPGWPCAGGATGSIRFAPEINHGANAGLVNAVALLEPIHAKYPDVSWADLIQMSSAVAIEVGPGVRPPGVLQSTRGRPTSSSPPPRRRPPRCR
jgi:L-ascorbate peroxidase